jgi:hypothetical protein
MRENNQVPGTLATIGRPPDPFEHARLLEIPGFPVRKVRVRSFVAAVLIQSSPSPIGRQNAIPWKSKGIRSEVSSQARAEAVDYGGISRSKYDTEYRVRQQRQSIFQRKTSEH